jgi:hypothetical protein
MPIWGDSASAETPTGPPVPPSSGIDSKLPGTGSNFVRSRSTTVTGAARGVARMSAPIASRLVIWGLTASVRGSSR